MLIRDDDAVHVVWGHSAAYSLRQAFQFPEDRLVVCFDAFSTGRQTLTPDYRVWREERRAAIAETYSNDFVADIEEDFGDLSFVRFRLVRTGRPVVLWSDGALWSHLLIAFLCYLFRESDWGVERLHIVQYRHEIRGHFPYLPIMTEADLRQFRPDTLRLDRKAVAHYCDFWSAFAGDNAERQVSVANDPAIRMLTLGSSAFIRRRYPNKTDGLDDIDRLLIEKAVEHAPDTRHVIARTLADGETPDQTSDLYLIYRIHQLSDEKLSYPLFHLEGDFQSLRSTITNVLQPARDILSGRASMIDLNGIDRWIGGVHLNNDAVVFQDFFP